MAVTQAGTRLTEAHRVQQARNAAIIALLVQQTWQRMVTPQSLGETALRWVELVLPQILAYSERSSALARTYTTALRALEVGGLEAYEATPVPLPTADQIRTSLTVTGQRTVEKTLAEIERRSDMSPVIERALLDKAMETAGAKAGGAAMRHTTAGGREQIKSAVREDRTALGWIRVTKANPCYFCAMMASRAIGGDGRLGIFYSEDSFDDSDSLFSGDGKAKAHDNCACSLQPVYSRDDKGLARSEEWSQLWATSTKGHGGQDAINAFRRAYEGR